MLARRKPRGPGFKQILRQWRDLRTLSPTDLAYYAITCRYCSPPLRDPNPHGPNPRLVGLNDKMLDFNKLDKACVLCDIVRSSYLHFIEFSHVDHENIRFMTISPVTVRNGAELCFWGPDQSKACIYLYS
jgi:hypothetical protein